MESGTPMTPGVPDMWSIPAPANFSPITGSLSGPSTKRLTPFGEETPMQRKTFVTKRFDASAVHANTQKALMEGAMRSARREMFQSPVRSASPPPSSAGANHIAAKPPSPVKPPKLASRGRSAFGALSPLQSRGDAHSYADSPEREQQQQQAQQQQRLVRSPARGNPLPLAVARPPEIFTLMRNASAMLPSSRGFLPPSSSTSRQSAAASSAGATASGGFGVGIVKGSAPMQGASACWICYGLADMIPCAHCDKPTCETCLRECAGCDDTFCTFCSTPNYDESYDRFFCLSCNY